MTDYTLVPEILIPILLKNRNKREREREGEKNKPSIVTSYKDILFKITQS